MKGYVPILLTCFLLLFTIVSCKKDITENSSLKSETLSASSNQSNVVSETASSITCVEDFDDGMGYDTVLKPTVLGYQLVNHPYSLTNMRQAYIHLYGSDDGVALTHKYVRFKPSSPQQLSVLEDLVSGYTNERFFNALDLDIRTLPDDRARLLNENNNDQAPGVNTIFGFYGY